MPIMKFPRFLSRFLGRDKKPEVTVIEKTVATVTESTFFSELNKGRPGVTRMVAGTVALH